MQLAAEVVLEVLRGANLGVPVHVLTPRKRPAGVWVRVDVGAPRRVSLVQERTLVIVQVYGPEGSNPDVVVDLGQKLRRYIDNHAPEHRLVSAWQEEQGLHSFPDPDVAGHRWQFSGVLFHTIHF